MSTQRDLSHGKSLMTTERIVRDIKRIKDARHELEHDTTLSCQQVLSRGAPEVTQERLATIEGKEVRVGAMGESAVGLLLVASDLKPIYANAEAIQILGYPEPPTSLNPSDSFLTHKIQSVLLADGNGAHVAFAVEFISGRRSYLCRPFTLTSHSNKAQAHPAFAVILERSSRKSLDVCQVAGRFHLT